MNAKQRYKLARRLYRVTARGFKQHPEGNYVHSWNDSIAAYPARLVAWLHLADFVAMKGVKP